MMRENIRDRQSTILDATEQVLHVTLEGSQKELQQLINSGTLPEKLHAFLVEHDATL